MPVFKKVNKDFFKTWSAEMAYVLGFFLADGSITINKRGGCYFAIQVTDGDIVVKIRNAMGSDHKISIKKGRELNHKLIYRLQIGSVEIVDDLGNLGVIEKKTHRLTLPDIPKECAGDFIRGYFDGDGNVWVGSVNKKRKNPTRVIFAAFTCSSESFLVNLLSLLRLQGIVGGNVYKAKGRGYYRLTLSTTDALKLYYIMYNVTCPIFLNRKRSVFERYIKMRL